MRIKKSSVTTKELRDFGLIFGVIIVSLFGLLLPWFFEKIFPLWPWLVFSIMGSMAVIYPLSLKYIFKVWMLFGAVMGWINTRLILGIVFYLMFVPFALAMKLLGKDPLSRKLDKQMITYRVTNNVSEKNNMENPF
jgi:predicted membrane channel-forming protein YqfA (hemolysin III family)